MATVLVVLFVLALIAAIASGEEGAFFLLVLSGLLGGFAWGMVSAMQS